MLFLYARQITGAIERADADVSIAITGYGGPEGGEDGTPAGTVWFAWHIKGQNYTAVMHFVISPIFLVADMLQVITLICGRKCWPMMVISGLLSRAD